jgi:hypothetical protein
MKIASENAVKIVNACLETIGLLSKRQVFSILAGNFNPADFGVSVHVTTRILGLHLTASRRPF